MLIRFLVALAALAAVGSAAATEQYSLFALPLPAGVTLTANDDLVPQAISADCAGAIYYIRNRTTGATTWYHYSFDYQATTTIAPFSTYQHLELLTIAGLAVGGRAWNEDGAGHITEEVPVMSHGDDILVAASSRPGVLAYLDNSSGYGQTHPTAPDFAGLTSARAAYWYVNTTTTAIPLLDTTVLQDRPALGERVAKRLFHDQYDDGSVITGDWAGGTYITADGGPGFWRYLRTNTYHLDLVPPPSALSAAYTTAATIPFANRGLVGSGRSLCRIGNDDDATLPTVSFLFDGTASTIIEPPGDAPRNVVRCGGLGEHGAQVIAVGTAKQRTGNATSGSDANQTSWVWSPGDAQATRLRDAVPAAAATRIGANANGITLDSQMYNAGQILCDGWDPDTATTTNADRRLLLLTPIPTLDLTVTGTAIHKDSQGYIVVTPIAAGGIYSYKYFSGLVTRATFGGTAVKDVDYQIEDDSGYTVVSQTSTSVDFIGRFRIVTLDNASSSVNQTITVQLDPAASGIKQVNAYKVGGNASATVTLVNGGSPIPYLSSSAPGSNAPLTISIFFDPAVTGFATGDLTASIGTLGAVSGSGNSYTTTWTPPANSAGNVTFAVGAGVANAASGGQANLAAAPLTVAYDTQSPVGVLSSPFPGTFAAGATAIPVVLAFNEPVGIPGVSAGLQVTGGSALSGSFFGHDASYHMTIVPSASTVTVSFLAAHAWDAAMNANPDSNVLTFNQTTATPVAVTVNQAAGQADPATTAGIDFTAVFAQAVTGFTLADVVIGGTVGGTKVAFVGNPSGDGKTYTITVTGMAVPSGTVTVSIPAGAAIARVGGSPTTVSISTDNVVTWNGPPGTPTTTLGRGAGTGNAPIAINVAFGAAVTGFANGDLTASSGSLGAIVGSGSSYSATWTPPANATGNATFSVSTGVAFAASGGQGNLPALPLVVAYDTQPPTAVLSSVFPGTFAAGATAIPVVLTFSEAVTGAGAAGFQVTGGTVLGGSFSGSGTTYQATIVPSASTVSVGYLAGHGADAATNGNAVANTLTFTQIAAVPVAVTVNQAAGQGDPTTLTSIAFTAVFAQAVTGFTAADVAIGGTAGGAMAATVANPGGDGRTYTITVTGMAAPNGTVTVAIPAAVASAAASGAPTAAATSTDNVVTWNAPAAGGGGGGPPGSGGGGCGLGGGTAALALMLLVRLVPGRRPRR